MTAAEKTLIEFCPSMEDGCLDSIGKAFKHQALKAMEAYASQSKTPKGADFEKALEVFANPSEPFVYSHNQVMKAFEASQFKGLRWVKASERKPDKDGGIVIRNMVGESRTDSMGYYEAALEEKESIFDEGDEWLDESTNSPSTEPSNIETSNRPAILSSLGKVWDNDEPIEAEGKDELREALDRIAHISFHNSEIQAMIEIGFHVRVARAALNTTKQVNK